MTDLSKLLEPIRPDLPTGEDVRGVTGDVTIGEIRRLREEQLAAELEGARANWAAVERACEEALATRTKDLEIAAWLCEALAHTEGFAGVRDGITYIGQLLDAFWSGLHPGLEGGEVVLPIRARPLNWLGSPKCFLPAVRAIPLATSPTGRPLAWRDYESSLRVDEAKTRSSQTTYQELIAAGNVDGETWAQALDGTPADRLADAVARLQECSASLEELEKRCGERFGEAEAPNLLELRDLLSAIREHVQGRLVPAEQGESRAAAGEGDAQPARRGPLGSRQEAVRQLGQVAAFFRETEPHSPVSYLVERAARWAAMPLADLYREVVKSPEVLARIWETLGIEPPPENR